MDTTTIILERAEGPVALCGKMRMCGEVISNV